MGEDEATSGLSQRAKCAQVLPDELKVYFGEKAFDSQDVRDAFEHQLDLFLARYGFYRWASGQELTTNVRDIAYDRRG